MTQSESSRDAQPDQAVLGAANLEYAEALFATWLNDASAVDPAWRQEFESWRATMNGSAPLSGDLGPGFASRSIFHRPSADFAPPTAASNASQGLTSFTDAAAAQVMQQKVDMLTRNHRTRGHIVADVNPLGPRSDDPVELHLDHYGFTQNDLDLPFTTNAIPGRPQATLREIHEHLRATYCSKIGVQFMHIDNLEVRGWLQERMESTRNRVTLTRKEQIRILSRLSDAVIFEEFIQRKFIGAKSFSLEGGESLIPLLDLAFERAGEQGCREIVLGMAHRGRLNVLANIMGKSPKKIFREFHDVDPEFYMGGGDVKYHLGYSAEWRTRTGQDIHLSLCFNPSHLEFVNPVALGRMRAKQDHARHRGDVDSRGEGGFVVLIHGDAAFIGEGIVPETLNLSELHGYKTGGTLHIVVNNQIGFTTPPRQSRSTRYATDVARMLQAPIIHVNGESPEAVASATRLACDFRREFNRDVVIDLYCYRRRGHNESDEPSYTQPLMYRTIDEHPPLHVSYLNELKSLGGVSDDDADRIIKRRTELLEKELVAAKSETFVAKKEDLVGRWSTMTGRFDDSVEEVETGLDQSLIGHLFEQITRLPEDFNLHPKLNRFIKQRKQMAAGERRVDWGTGEALAFASMLTEDKFIRLSGQDAQRGTFSHRHSVLHDHQTDEEFRWFRDLKCQDGSEATGHMVVLNSPLSEMAVLGFEYGYSLDTPDGLILWEAQFGDFVNCAQVIIDQFITSAEDKWNRLSGLVMLLPHGFEGQGPEHSSARLERFLTQCAEDNIQVVHPSTPAQYFHVLRRQLKRPYRKPLIVLTPKSLLRLPACSSRLEAFSYDRFKRVIQDRGGTANDDGSSQSVPPAGVKRALLCSGKIYYELFDRRAELERHDIAILRLEQYYPFPGHLIEKELSPYQNLKELVWVQEEPENMGAWNFLKLRKDDPPLSQYNFRAITRSASASPATGSRAAHLIEQEAILTAAFA